MKMGMSHPIFDNKNYKKYILLILCYISTILTLFPPTYCRWVHLFFKIKNMRMMTNSMGPGHLTVAYLFMKANIIWTNNRLIFMLFIYNIVLFDIKLFGQNYI